MFDALYRNVRLRVTKLATSLTGEQLAARVAGTPEWTGRQVLAHMVGVAADTVAGNLDGAPSPRWTAAHVAKREGRSLDELLAEWDEVGPVVEARLAARELGPIMVYDVLTHECDLRETFGLGRPPQEDVDAVARTAAKGTVKGFTGPGMLVVRSGGQEWAGGGGEPRTVLTVEPYELLRGLISRRSRRQMRAWSWEGGNPAEMIEKLPVFGARDDDQPVPV
jgi:uncharacterized protein (TIGR03083 family)